MSPHVIEPGEFAGLSSYDRRLHVAGEALEMDHGGLSGRIAHSLDRTRGAVWRDAYRDIASSRCCGLCISTSTPCGVYGSYGQDDGVCPHFRTSALPELWTPAHCPQLRAALSTFHSHVAPTALYHVSGTVPDALLHVPGHR